LVPTETRRACFFELLAVELPAVPGPEKDEKKAEARDVALEGAGEEGVKECAVKAAEGEAAPPDCCSCM
jgi:hypothetical protein